MRLRNINSREARSYAKHKEPGKQELICDREVEAARDEHAVNERAEREKHNGNAEDVQGLRLYAAKSADARNEHQHTECRSENSDEIEREQAFDRLKYGGDAREYVDQADDASDLLVFAFCHGFVPSF